MLSKSSLGAVLIAVFASSVAAAASAAPVSRHALAVLRAPSTTVRAISHRSGHFTEYSIPTGYSDPRYITAGPDGALWFTEYSSRKIGRITTSGVFTEYAQPPQSQGSAPWGIAAGPDGAMWFAGAYASSSGPGAIGRITTSGQLTYYAVPNLYPYGITAGPGGNMWFTADYYVGKITMSGDVTLYKKKDRSHLLFEIAAAPNGRLYFSVDNGNNRYPYLGSMDTHGAYSEEALQGEGTVNGLTIDPVSGLLWFTQGARRLGFLGTDGNPTEYQIGGPDNPPLPMGIAAGPHGDLWFTELGRNAIGRIVNGDIEEHELPMPRSFPQRIAAGPDGALWFTESLANRIGRYQP